jgi:hypothetical protein
MRIRTLNGATYPVCADGERQQDFTHYLGLNLQKWCIEWSYAIEEV